MNVKKKARRVMSGLLTAVTVLSTVLSPAVAYASGAEGLPDDTITLNLTGSTGQSFMAFGMKW